MMCTSPKRHLITEPEHEFEDSLVGMSSLTLEFSIKYSTLDYLHAVNYNYNCALKSLKNKKTVEYLISKFIKPFAVLCIVVIAKFGQLKSVYHFKLGEKFRRSTKKQISEVNWVKFLSYSETSKSIFLHLDKNQGNDGQVLIPKRFLNNNEILILKCLLETNKIHESEFD